MTDAPLSDHVEKAANGSFALHQIHKARAARWEKHHSSPELWFWERVDATKPDGCWPWMGRAMKKRGGYGRLQFNGRLIGAHRMALILKTGENDPAKFACHHCDNPICCNPSHLFWGTHQDNMNDCTSKGRKKGAPRKIDVDVMLEMRGHGAAYSAIAARFHVNQASVAKALKRAALKARGL